VGIDQFIQRSKIDKLNSHLAKWISTSVMSFHLLRNPHFADFVNELLPFYKVPSEHMIAGPFLDAEFNEIVEWKTNILARGKIKVAGDGYTNRRRVGLINIEACSSCTDAGVVHHNTIQRESNGD
jgi:hypothetical protein